MTQDTDQIDAINILIVEDKVSYHEVYRTTICYEFPNAKLSFASTGEDAKKMVNDGLTDLHLVILDYGLPDVSGEELLDFFRKQESFRHTPIMFLTGQSDDQLQSRLLSKGANDFVEKGSSPDLLLARIGIQIKQKLLMDGLTEKAVNMEMFTSGVLHDIRNIEANVIGYCELVERRVKKEPELVERDKIMRDLENLKLQAYRINEYANDILKKVRMTSKTYEPVTINLEETLEWVRGILSVEGDFHLHQDTPIDPIFADPAMIKLVLLNLCQNSAKYRKSEGECHVYVSQDMNVPLDASHVTLFIEDDGIGVPEEELNTIFLPFQRATNHSDRNGMGLGLAMVNKVVQTMGGKIWATAGKNGLKINLQLKKAEG